MSALTFRRLFDLLAIMALAGGLLGAAWRLTSRGAESATTTTPSEELPLLESAEPQLLLPLEPLGMVLTRESVPGEAALAVAHLEHRCKAILTTPDIWVLSLAVPAEEQALLDALPQHPPSCSETTSPGGHTWIARLDSPTSRIGVRQSTGPSATTERRLLCWGFVLAEGTDQQTVWFARPRETFPHAVSREGPPP